MFLEMNFRFTEAALQCCLPEFHIELALNGYDESKLT